LYLWCLFFIFIIHASTLVNHKDNILYIQIILLYKWRQLIITNRSFNFPVNKRIKTLVRQPHLKITDCDMSTETTSMIKTEANDESEPVIRVLERQCSEPNPSSTNTLAVPKPTIVKQLSQPSESCPTPRGYYNDELLTSASQVYVVIHNDYAYVRVYGRNDIY